MNLVRRPGDGFEGTPGAGRYIRCSGTYAGGSTMEAMSKGMLTFAAVATGVTALTVAGTEKIVGEGGHRKGEPFSDLAKWELGLGATAAVSSLVTGVISLGQYHSSYSNLGHDSAITHGTGQASAALAGIALGIVAGRLISQTSAPSVSLGSG